MRFFRDDRGATAVEFAMISMALLMLLVGAMEVARLVWVLQSLDRATQNTARYRFTTVTTNTALQTYLQDQLTTAGLDGSAASCSAPSSATPLVACVKDESVSGNNYITVQAQYYWQSMIPFISSTATLTRESRVPK